MSDEEFEALKGLRDGLKVIYLCMKKMSKDSINLAETDKVFEFLLPKLAQNKTIFGESLFQNVKQRILERRNIVLSTLVAIVNGEFILNDTEDKMLKYASENEVLQLGEAIVEKFLNRSISNDEISIESMQFENLEDELDQIFTKKPKVTNENSFKEAFQIFKSSKIVPDLFGKLAKILNSITPSSIVPERLFSLAGNFIRIRRSRISGDLLDALILVSTSNL